MVVWKTTPSIDTTGTRWEADLVVVATGAAFDHLPGTERVAAQVRRVRLQMLETEPYPGELTTALADADTLRYYPAYEVVPQDLSGAQSAVAAAHHLQLLLVQRADGGLTIGDTHAYDEPFDFALAEDPSLELLEPGRETAGCAAAPGRPALGGCLRPVHRRCRVRPRRAEPRRVDGHRARRTGHDLLARHRGRHARGGGGALT